MEEILGLIKEYNSWFYLITFIWTVLEGETFVIFAGLAAQKGLLDIHWLFLAAGAGSMLGDQICFFIGRRYGRRVIHRFPKLEPKMERVFQLLEKYSISFILSYRFMYGIRNVSALTIGMSHLTWRRFFVLNAIASFVWSFTFCAMGYLMGDLVDQFGVGEDDVRNMMIAVLLLFVLIIGMRIFFARRNIMKKSSEKEKNDSLKESEIEVEGEKKTAIKG